MFLLCLQAFKEMLYAAQDQAPSIEGITCMRTQPCTYGFTGNDIDFLFLSPSLVLRAVGLTLSYFVLETIVLSFRCKTTRVTAEHGPNPNPTIPKY